MNNLAKLRYKKALTGILPVLPIFALYSLIEDLKHEVDIILIISFISLILLRLLRYKIKILDVSSMFFNINIVDYTTKGKIGGMQIFLREVILCFLVFMILISSIMLLFQGDYFLEILLDVFLSLFYTYVLLEILVIYYSPDGRAILDRISNTTIIDS